MGILSTYWLNQKTVKLQEKTSWIDSDTRLEKAMYKILREFVEKECAWMYYRMCMGISFWKFLFLVTHQEKVSAGIRYIQMSVDNADYYSEKENYKKILEIYHMIVDRERYGEETLDILEENYYLETNKLLKDIIDIRFMLWT